MVVAGGIGYAFLFGMTITSFDGLKKGLGSARWNLLHKTEMWGSGDLYLHVSDASRQGPRDVALGR